MKATQKACIIQRFLPCSLVRHRIKKTLHIVAYDYSYVYDLMNGECDFQSLCLFDLNDEGNITREWSWADAQDYELVDDKNGYVYLQKITEYQLRE